MPAAPSASAAPAPAVAQPIGLGNNRGIKFNIKTGGAHYSCILQDRSTYERTKATRTNSTDSSSSSVSEASN